MSRWLLPLASAIVLVATIAFVWQWTAAEPLDPGDDLDRWAILSTLGQQTIYVGLPGERPPQTHVVTIGHWEYRVTWPDPPEPVADGTTIAPEYDKRPITLMARFRVWLGAD